MVAALAAGGLTTALVAAAPSASASPAVAGPSSAAASVGVPKVTGPVTGGAGKIVMQTTNPQVFTAAGYTQSEFLISGTATSYAAAGPLGVDGKWQAKPATTAPYTTRMIVYKPEDPARFNGTVLVEWLNVSSLADVPPDWIYAHEELTRQGYAWVGVSAQWIGALTTQLSDLTRYAAMSHPGDSYSYDIFSQAGQAIRTSAGAILGGAAPQRLLADGESQSAMRLTTYVNAVHPLAQVYDGFLVHSRGAISGSLSQWPQADVPVPNNSRFRTDLDEPVLVVESESDLMELDYLPARQDDTPGFRLWELAGTSHIDDYAANVSANDDGALTWDQRQFANMLQPPLNIAEALTCEEPVNTSQHNYAFKAAVHGLNRWVSTGQAPPSAPRLQVTTTGQTRSLVLDPHGIAKGGVRSPAVDVPVATLSGLGQASPLCAVFGTTVPFAQDKLKTLYPTHAQFVARWTQAVQAQAQAGFLLPADAENLIRVAETSTIGQ